MMRGAPKLVMVHCHLRMLRMQKEGKWEEDLLEWHEEDEMWEVREEGGEEDYDSDDEPLQTSRQSCCRCCCCFCWPIVS